MGTVEINNKLYQVASIPFTQFFEQENYRLVIMREKSESNQIDMFTGDAFVYRSISTNDGKVLRNKWVNFIAKGVAVKNFLMLWTMTLTGNTCHVHLCTKTLFFQSLLQ